MFLSVITKNFTFKRWDGVKDEKFEYYRVHWKIRYLGGGGVTKSQYIGEIA